MYSLTDIVQVIIIFQGSLLTLFILISNKGTSRNDFFLSLLIGTLTLQILGMFLINRNVQPDLVETIAGMYLFLYGPLLFLYSKHITFSGFRLKLKHLIHFIPFFTVLVLASINKEFISQFTLYMAYAIHILIYILACFWQLRRYKKVLMDNYSKLEQLNLRWLRWVLLIFTLIVFVDGIQIGSILISQKTLRLEIIVFLLILSAINLLYFSGFKKGNESKGFNDEDLELSTAITYRKRINTGLLQNKKLIDYLENHMDSTASFKNPNLTIGLLSEELDISKRILSELINDHYDQNFSDFINSYRIISAKHSLMNPTEPNETILEVMYDVGFNSKSSFYKAFKKKTGLTPTEFKSNN